MTKENLSGGVIIPMVGVVENVTRKFLCVKHLVNYEYEEPIYGYEYVPIQERRVVLFDEEEQSYRWFKPTEEGLKKLSPIEVGQEIYFNFRDTWTKK